MTFMLLFTRGLNPDGFRDYLWHAVRDMVEKHVIGITFQAQRLEKQGVMQTFAH